jgi:predicted DCC family thiol-disulfide oxidoreductase YuxK
MVWVDRVGEGAAERVRVRSDAALAAAGYLGGAWKLAVLGRLVPRLVRDAAYDFVARHRHRMFAEPEQCYLPPPPARGRFLA